MPDFEGAIRGGANILSYGSLRTWPSLCSGLPDNFKWGQGVFDAVKIRFVPKAWAWPELFKTPMWAFM